VAVPRESLPPTRENEFYQADLIGLEVRNMDGERLGTVAGMFSNGAHDVMRLAGDEGERLLPFIEQVVREVDIGAGRIRVDWGKDW
jgi:16S rRNA processing protein RimM